MNDRRDLELVLESGTPLIVIETTDEARVLELLREIALAAVRERVSSVVPLVDHRRPATTRSRPRSATPQRRARGRTAAYPRGCETRHLRAARLSSVPERAGAMSGS